MLAAVVVQPRIDTHNFRRLVVLTDFSEVSKTACAQALWLAEKDAVECVHVISIHTIFMDARARMGTKDGKPARTRVQEERLMEDSWASLPKCQVQIDWNIVDATTGFAACEFAESAEADLLVLPGYNRPQGRVPPLADWGSKSCRAVSGLCRAARRVTILVVTTLAIIVIQAQLCKIPPATRRNARFCPVPAVLEAVAGGCDCGRSAFERVTFRRSQLESGTSCQGSAFLSSFALGQRSHQEVGSAAASSLSPK